VKMQQMGSRKGARTRTLRTRLKKRKGNFEGVDMRAVNRGGNKMKAKQEG
jgi:hypothetical protein